MLKRASQKLVGGLLLCFLAVSVVIVELHFTGLLPDFYRFLDGLDAKVNLNDGKLTLSRWSSSVFMEVGGRQDAPRATGSIFDGMSLVFSDYEVQVYSLPIDDGGIEYAVILKSNPNKASLDLPFRSANLDFFYQAALDKELNVSEYDFVNATHAIKDGLVVMSRPENVVDSYAVYHSSKMNNEYKSGKAFHIYRPQLIDANGAKCWGTLQIADGFLKVGLDQKWLANAAYPVMVDPAFGKTTLGATNQTSTTDAIYGTHFLGEFGGIDSISVYCTTATSGQKECAIYNRTGATTGVYYVNTTKIVTTTQNAWNTFAINSTDWPAIRSQYYYLFVWGYNINYKYDTITPSSTWRSAYRSPLTYGNSVTWPTSLASFVTNVNRIYSIFANYSTPYTFTSTWTAVPNSNATYNSSSLISQIVGYAASWNASSANNYAVTTFQSGRRRLSTTFYVRRSFLFFDCLNLSAYSTLISAKFTFNATAITTTWANLSATLGVYAPLSGQVHPASPILYSEYNYAYYAGGSLLGANTSGLVLNADNDIILNVSAVNRTAVTKLIVRTVNEYNNDTSGFSMTTNNEESVSFTDPRLTLTYTIPSAPTVEEPCTVSPYINTSGNLSAVAYADANLSMIVLEDNYTSGTIQQTNVTAPASTTTQVINFTKTWNSSIVTVKWRIWCNDTYGFTGSTEWQYTKIGPQYPSATVTLASTGTSVSAPVLIGGGVNLYAINNYANMTFYSATNLRQIQFVNITTNSSSPTDLRIYEIVGYYANGTKVSPASATFANYYTSAYPPSNVCDNSNTTYWDVAGSAFQPANLTIDFNGAYTFTKLGIFTPSNVAANITVAYVYASNCTGNMTEVGQSPVVGNTDYNGAYPGYLNSSGAARQSNNFSFAPFTLSSSNVWAIDFTMNWTTTNSTWIRVSMYSPLGAYSADVSPIANSTWTIQSVTLSYAYESCADVNSTYVSFYSYNSTTVLIDNCSLVVTYNNLNSIETEMNINTIIGDNNKPLDVSTAVMHCLVFAYTNIADNFYWVAAYDETLLQWITPVNTTVQVPIVGETGHYSPSIGLLPNGSIVMFIAHEAHLKYYITVNSTTTESNITTVLSHWGSEQEISTDLYSYPYAVSFSDRLLLFTQTYTPGNANMTMFTFNTSGVYEHKDMIYTKTGSTFYGMLGHPNKLSNDKLYFSWVKYDNGPPLRSNVYCITSSDRGSSWTYMNGTACTFPIESSQALVLTESNVWDCIVLDEGTYTSLYAVSFKTVWWDTPESSTSLVKYSNASTLAPNSGLTWQAATYCVDEFGANITSFSPTVFYDSTSNKTFFWAMRQRIDALTNPYNTKYQKIVGNRFFMYLQNCSFLNFVTTATNIYEPSVPYETIATVGKRGICGIETTGSTQFNATQQTLYLYPYTATVSENITQIIIRVNLTTDSEMIMRGYALYDQNLHLMSYGRYGIDSSYGTAPINTWEYVTLNSNNTVNNGVVAGQTYWIGVIYYNDSILFFPQFTCGYYKNASATNGRFYADFPTNAPSDISGYSYGNDTGYTLSVFLISNRVVLYGVWDTLACQMFSMNRTTIAFNTPLAVEFAAQWLDYRGLDQLWFTENSTGSYSEAEYNDTEGASTFWCNRTYTLTITSGLIIDCVMYASNSLGDQMAVHLYIRTFAVNLVVGWNNLTTISQDVGYSLGQVCANIQYDQLDAEIIVYNNGSSFQYNYGYAANLAVNITAADYSLSIYSLTAGTWYRAYNQFAWRYIQAGDVKPSGSSGFSMGRGFTLGQLVNLFPFRSLAVELKLQSSQILSLFGNGFVNAERRFSSSQLINLFPNGLLNKELQFTSGTTVNLFGSVVRSMELLFTSRQTLTVFGNSLLSKELQFTSSNTVTVLGSTGLGKAFGYVTSSMVNVFGNSPLSKELAFRASNLANLFGSSSLSKELSFVSGPVVNVFSSLSKGVGLAFSPSQTVNVFSSVSGGRGLAFLQGQTLNVFPSLWLGKELGFTPSGTLNVLGYIVPLGPRDLSYALSGLLNGFSSNPFSKELRYTSSSQLSVFGGNVFGRELGFTSSPLFTVYGSGVIGKELVLVSSGLVNLFGGGQSNLGRGFTTSQTLTTIAPSDRYQALYESVNVGDDGSLTVYGTNWYAQSFSVVNVHDVVLVRLKLYRVGSPGDFVVGVRAVDGSGFPTGEDLTNGTVSANGFTVDSAGEWVNVPVSTYSFGVADYALVVRATSGGPADYVGWRCIAVGSYGSVKSSGDGGTSWADYTP